MYGHSMTQLGPVPLSNATGKSFRLARTHRLLGQCLRLLQSKWAPLHQLASAKFTAEAIPSREENLPEKNERGSTVG